MIPLKFGLGRFVRLHDCCIYFGKIRDCSLNKSHHDYILPYNELLNICLFRQNWSLCRNRVFRSTKRWKST